MTEWGVHPLAQALGWALLHFLWQGALVGLVMALGLRLMRSRTAQARYGFACGGFLVMALMPALTFALQPRAGLAPGMIEVIRETGASLPSQGSGSLIHSAQVAVTPWLPWALGIWMVGVALLSLRMLGAWFWLQGLRDRQVAPAGAEWHLRLSTLQRRLGIHQTVELLKSAAVQVPLVIGWLRPVILVPASAFLGLSPEALEAVLAHELAHIRRHDYLVNLLQSIVEILLFYHPAVWWLSTQIRTERENCCDDVAVAYCGDALAYAKALAALEGLREPVLLRTELALAADGGSLMHRIQRLILPTLPPSPNRRAAILATLAVSVLGAGSVLRMKEDAPKPQVTPEAKTEKVEKRTVVMVGDGQNVRVRTKGKVELKPDSPEIVIVGEGGSFDLKVKEGGKSRVFTVSRDAKGETRTYTEDGQPKPLDLAWLKTQVKAIQKNQVKTPTPPPHPKRQIDVTVVEDGGSRIEKHIVIDTEKIRQDVDRHMKEMEKHRGELELGKGDLERHKAELERHKAIILKGGDLEVPDMDFDVDIDIDKDGDEEATPRPHIVMKRFKHGAGGKHEAEILRSTIEKLQRRLDRLEEEEETSATVPKPPTVPRTPRPFAAPKPPKAPPAPVEAPAPPAPPQPPSSL